MATNFPTGNDAFVTPSQPAITPLSSAGDSTRNHIESHQDMGDSIVALEQNVPLLTHDHSGTGARATNNIAQSSVTGLTSALNTLTANVNALSSIANRSYLSSTVLINSTTNTNIISQNVSAGVYKIQAQIVYIPNASAGTPVFVASNGTAAISGGIGQAWYGVSGGGTGSENSYVYSGTPQNFGGPTLTSGGLFVFNFLGFMQFLTSGTFLIQARENNPGDSFTIQSFSWLEIGLG